MLFTRQASSSFSELAGFMHRVRTVMKRMLPYLPKPLPASSIPDGNMMLRISNPVVLDNDFAGRGMWSKHYTLYVLKEPFTVNYRISMHPYMREEGVPTSAVIGSGFVKLPGRNMVLGHAQEAGALVPAVTGRVEAVEAKFDEIIDWLNLVKTVYHSLTTNKLEVSGAYNTSTPPATYIIAVQGAAIGLEDIDYVGVRIYVEKNSSLLELGSRVLGNERIEITCTGGGCSIYDKDSRKLYKLLKRELREDPVDVVLSREREIIGRARSLAAKVFEAILRTHYAMIYASV